MPDFGIQKAIELMRDLPAKDSDVVVKAVCKTLSSIGIEVPDIIDQAKKKQGNITDRIKNLRDEIADLEEEIAGRKEEIQGLEADHAETGDVRARLEKATSPDSSNGVNAADKGPVKPSRPITSKNATLKPPITASTSGTAPKPPLA